MRPISLTPLLLAIALFGCGSDRSVPGAPVSLSVQTAAEEEAGTLSQIGAMERVPGTRVLTAYLRLPVPKRSGRQLSSRSSGDYERHRYLNQLFYDLDTRKARWLFETNEQRILKMTPIERRGEEPAVRAYLYRILNPGEDENKDAVHLALSSPDGTGYTVVAEQVDEVLGRFPVDDDRMVIWYRSGGSVAGVEVDLDKPAVLHRTLLAMPAVLNPTEA